MSARATGKLGGTTDLIRPLQMQGTFFYVFIQENRTDDDLPCKRNFYKKRGFHHERKIGTNQSAGIGAD